MKMSKITGSFALAMSVISASAYGADYKWGAIALDTADLSPDGGYGIGGGDSEQEAKDYALKFCATDGAKGCAIVTTYQKCGSVAVKKAGQGGAWGIGDTKDGATARALTQCGGEDTCKVVVTDCN